MNPIVTMPITERATDLAEGIRDAADALCELLRITGTGHTSAGAPASTLYTPGPWDYDMDFIVAPDPNGIHPDIYIAEIVHTDEEGRLASPEQQDANRRLIAAAPELLAALDYLLAQTVDMDLEYGIGLTEGEQDARTKALDAITKATASQQPILERTKP